MPPAWPAPKQLSTGTGQQVLAPHALPVALEQLPPGSLEVVGSAAGAVLGSLVGRQLVQLIGRAAVVDRMLPQSHHPEKNAPNLPPARQFAELITLVGVLLGGSLGHYVDLKQLFE